MTDASSTTTEGLPGGRRAYAAHGCVRSGDVTAGESRPGASYPPSPTGRRRVRRHARAAHASSPGAAPTAGEASAPCRLPAARMTAPKEHGHG
ncbi:hypothetical protein SPURM210S_00601 [Streptomyces purpurascens]